MRRTKRFLIISIVVLTLSLLADQVGAFEEPSQHTKSQVESDNPTEAHQQVSILVNILEKKFGYYYEHLSMITNSIEEDLLRNDPDNHLIGELQVVRSDLEVAKQLADDAIVGFTYYSENDQKSDVFEHSLGKIVDSKNQYKASIQKLKHIVSKLDSENE